MASSTFRGVLGAYLRLPFANWGVLCWVRGVPAFTLAQGLFYKKRTKYDRDYRCANWGDIAPRLRFLFSTTPFTGCLPVRRRWQRLQIRQNAQSTLTELKCSSVEKCPFILRIDANFRTSFLLSNNRSGVFRQQKPQPKYLQNTAKGSSTNSLGNCENWREISLEFR